MSAVDQLRVQNSALASFGAHGALFTLYLILRVVAPPPDLLISQVEFLDFIDDTEPQEAPAAMRPPKSFKDLLNMVLPQSAPSEPVESQPQDIQTPTFDRLQTLSVRRPAFKIDDRKLEARAPIRLKAAPTMRGTSPAFAEMAKTGPAPAADLSMMETTPDIDIAAVGRRAVTGTPAVSIRIDPTAKASTLGLAGIRTVSRSVARTAMSARTGAEIQLGDSRPIRRGRGRLPKGSLPAGYARGGSGISLKTSPIARRSTAKIPQKIAAVRVADLVPEVGEKAVEISGPLAQRKVVDHELPAYPGWARDKGIEAEVVIRFFVSKEGHVRDRMILERTSGYPELDKISMKALKKWLFIALPAERAQEGDQWGIITFRFRLK